MPKKINWNAEMDEFITERKYQNINKTLAEFQEHFGTYLRKNQLEGRYSKLFRMPRRGVTRIVRSSSFMARGMKTHYSWTRFCGLYVGALRHAPFGIYMAPTKSLMRMGLRDIHMKFLRECDILIEGECVEKIRKDWVEGDLSMKELGAKYDLSRNMIYMVVMGDIHPTQQYQRRHMETVRYYRRLLISVFEGEPAKSAQEWALDPRCHVSWETIAWRHRCGMRGESLLNPLKPRNPPQYYQIFNEYKTIKEWSEDPRCDIPFATLRKRVRTGWKINGDILRFSGVNKCRYLSGKKPREHRKPMPPKKSTQ